MSSRDVVLVPRERSRAAGNYWQRARRALRMAAKNFDGSRRVRIAVLVVVGTLCITVGGFVGSRFMTSPEQVAASAGPPPPSVITAPVELRVVSENLVTRGEVFASQSTNLLSNRAMTGAALNVITSLPVAQGDPIQDGSVVVEISGRPVIALVGAFPAYRDLSIGASGSDVVQLQAALSEVGMSTAPDTPGVFGEGTDQALRALYAGRSYTYLGSLPRAEIYYSPTFPALVQSSNAVLGGEAEGMELWVATGTVGVGVQSDGRLDKAVHVGDPVEIVSELLGLTVPGKVSDLSAPAPLPPTDGEQTQPSWIVVEPNSALGPEWGGQNVRVTFLQSGTDGEVLAVPVGAVYTSADGGAEVRVVQGDKSQVLVQVRTGAVGGGYIEVVPIDGELRANDNVVLGLQ